MQLCTHINYTHEHLDSKQISLSSENIRICLRDNQKHIDYDDVLTLHIGIRTTNVSSKNCDFDNDFLFHFDSKVETSYYVDSIMFLSLEFRP